MRVQDRESAHLDNVLLSYAVAQRRREIAVRMALGARPSEIQRQFLLLALRLLAGGAILGLFGAWVAGRAMQTILFHVPAHSSAILTASAGIIAVVALTACLLPAQRAVRNIANPGSRRIDGSSLGIPLMKPEAQRLSEISPLSQG